jgi:beta-lactamase class A
VRRAPAHAGSLKQWERLAFTLAFVLMAALVVVVTVSAARARLHGAQPAGPAVTGQSGQLSGDTTPGNSPSAGSGGSPGEPPRRPLPVAPGRRLAAALAPLLLHHTGRLAVGVIDRSTGVRAVYDGGRQFAAAGIIKSDILAVLLLENQQAGTGFGAGELQLAAQMIEANDAAATDVLWQDAGGPGGVALANADLGLRHTTPGQGIPWGLTGTTVGDQLSLLADLTSAQSPLTAGSRRYELSLMRKAAARQAWGVRVAATEGSSCAVRSGSCAVRSGSCAERSGSYAVRSGSPAGRRLWVVTSIGVIRHAGQQLLVAVLSDGQPTKSAGIAQLEAAAVAAVTEITARRP